MKENKTNSNFTFDKIINLKLHSRELTERGSTFKIVREDRTHNLILNLANIHSQNEIETSIGL